MAHAGFGEFEWAERVRVFTSIARREFPHQPCRTVSYSELGLGSGESGSIVVVWCAGTAIVGRQISVSLDVEPRCYAGEGDCKYSILVLWVDGERNFYEIHRDDPAMCMPLDCAELFSEGDYFNLRMRFGGGFEPIMGLGRHVNPRRDARLHRAICAGGYEVIDLYCPNVNCTEYGGEIWRQRNGTMVCIECGTVWEDEGLFRFAPISEIQTILP